MKILLIDDEVGILEFLSISLEAEGFLVDVADNGEKGIQMIMNNHYDLVVLDYSMPKKDGKWVCQQTRQSGRTVPIIMLSVKSGVSDKIDLLSAGADDYLTKPFSFKELLARINALIRRSSEMKGNKILVGDLLLDRDACSVKRGDKEISLTQKEFYLLEYLMENEGKMVSRAMITERIWGKNLKKNSGVIGMHILNLRKKIDGNRKIKLIKTVPGRGYKIDGN